ncbi:MAG: hypothetical protein U0414_40020 [Polyangiaceae bacterium]
MSLGLRWLASSVLVLGMACSQVIGCSDDVVIERHGGRPDPPTEEPSAAARCEGMETSLATSGNSAIDPMGSADGPGCDTWLVGAFSGTVTFPDGTTIVGGSEWDGFVARLGPQGERRWAVRIEGSPDSWADYVVGVAVDARGRSWVTGSADGPLEVGGQTVLEESGHFILALDEDGHPRWAARLGYFATHVEEADGVVTVYGTRDAELVRTTFDADAGAASTHVLASGPMSLFDVATSPAGSVFVIVQNGDMTVGSQTVPTHDSEEDKADLALVVLSPDGALRWARSFAETGFAPIEGRAAIDDKGQVHAFVSYTGSIDVGGDVLTASPDASMSLLGITLDDDGALIAGASLGAGDIALPMWTRQATDGQVVWAGRIEDGVISLGSVVVDSSAVTAYAGLGVGFLTQVSAAGDIFDAQPIANLDHVGGSHAEAPILSQRTWTDDGLDRGLRVTRGAFDLAH